MSKSKKFKQKWLPLALVPLFSVTVLAGCDSDDDDDGDGGVTITPDAVVGDADGNNIPDAFETLNAAEDTNGNGIIDTFDAELTSGADANGNAVDDSFEAALTNGPDAEPDGVDDEALAAVTGGGTDPTDGTGGTEPVDIDQTGPLEVSLSDAGCLLYTSPSPRDRQKSRMPSSA